MGYRMGAHIRARTTAHFPALVCFPCVRALISLSPRLRSQSLARPLHLALASVARESASRLGRGLDELAHELLRAGLCVLAEQFRVERHVCEWLLATAARAQHIARRAALPLELIPCNQPKLRLGGLLDEARLADAPLEALAQRRPLLQGEARRLGRGAIGGSGAAAAPALIVAVVAAIVSADVVPCAVLAGAPLALGGVLAARRRTTIQWVNTSTLKKPTTT